MKIAILRLDLCIWKQALFRSIFPPLLCVLLNVNGGCLGRDRRLFDYSDALAGFKLAQHGSGQDDWRHLMSI